jgi:hypothetical protein
VSHGFRPHELADIVRILEDHVVELMAAWAAAEVKRGNGTGEG